MMAAEINLNNRMHRSSTSTPTRRLRAPIEGLFCNFSQRVCMQNRVEGTEYCIRHVHEDKTSLYRQCNYTSTRNGKRCTNAAPKADKKEGYCPDHCKLMMAYRYKMAQKQKPKESAESLINDLSHYSKEKEGNNEEGKDGKPKGAANSVLEYGSSGESEGESLELDQTWTGEVESDGESVDSEQEDLLKHAGIYTSEEVALIMRDKLIRLQSLYIEQFKRLQHVMKERRRKYLHTAKHDRDLAPLSTYKHSPKYRQNYFKFLALRKYHRRHGKEAWLHRQSKERRIAVSESFNYRPPLFPQCIDMTAGVKCANRVLPLSKYCLQHIISDHNQVLYHTCTFADCTRPVLESTNEPSCEYHARLLPPSLVAEAPVDATTEQVSQESNKTDNQPETETDPTPFTGMDSLLDPIDLDHMTWNASESSLSSTISRLTSSLAPHSPTVPNMDVSMETGHEQVESTVSANSIG